MQIASKQLNALNIVPPIQLLIDGVSSISTASHRQKQNILTSRLLKGERHWYRASLSRQVRLDTPHLLHRLGRSSEVPVLRRRYPPFAAVLQEALHAVLRLQRLEDFVAMGVD